MNEARHSALRKADAGSGTNRRSPPATDDVAARTGMLRDMVGSRDVGEAPGIGEAAASAADATSAILAGAAFATSPRRSEILGFAVDEAARLLHADGAIVYVLDPDGALRFGHAAGIGNPDQREAFEGLRLPARSGLFGLAIAEGRPQVTSDYLADPRFAHTENVDAVARRLGLHVDTRHGNKLTRQIARTWNPKRELQLRHWRARYDERFSPAEELRATAAYLARARTVLGRDDLAIQAYHVGIPALRGTDASYAELYFNGGHVDDYALKVFAAARIMHLYRANRAALAFEAQQQARKNSAEEYLHPLYRTHRFPSPGALLRAEQRRVLRLIPVHTRTTHILVGGALGGEARAFGRSRRLYRALRPAALDVLLYIGKRVHELSGARKPLILTSAVRDLKYQRVLMRVNANAARSYSLHTAGYAFDIARSYGSKRQANAFQYVLDRLTAANAVAYIREAAAIHVAVAADAPEKLKLLETLG